ncbi:4Fe-4S binding protein [Aestuariimicrobium sp. T2.26MG-19.2B]|uniref:4Fe-4S binding protein n=1 Tax=Aestuariimicrobium sp. T2.26MG-19.2B TaxID=3040679 RepID=UPI002477B0BB|nr:NAD(P)H-quinone oxidoreductase subunit I, chloroplastic [Aestuariimicrobium sp. T2.26MG-19.2B]
MTGTGHGRIELLEDRCTSCMICVRECPTWCISIDSHSVVIADEEPAGARPPGRRRERTANVLDSFDIDFTLCMYCGICIEECPFDALQWAGSHVAAGDSREALVHGRDALAPMATSAADEADGTPAP